MNVNVVFWSVMIVAPWVSLAVMVVFDLPHTPAVVSAALPALSKPVEGVTAVETFQSAPAVTDLPPAGDRVPHADTAHPSLVVSSPAGSPKR